MSTTPELPEWTGVYPSNGVVGPVWVKGETMNANVKTTKGGNENE